MFGGVFASFEGFFPQKIQELSQLVHSNGGIVTDMLTHSTTHLIVNPNRQQGFQEVLCANGNHQAWILQEEFITQSLRAGMKLPEFQFGVRRITNQDHLEPPLEIESNETTNESHSIPSRDDADFEPVPELQEHLENSEGGQVWGIGGDPMSSQIGARYLLGAAGKPPAKTCMAGKEAKKKTIKRKKNGNRRGKQTTRAKALKYLADKEKIEADENTKDLGPVYRSDEELFVCAVPWQQNTLMVSADGKLWLRTGSLSPTIMSTQPPIAVCSIACGKSHALALTIAGQVYSWGSSYAGQLGHGDMHPVSAPKRIQQVLGNMPVIQISATGDSSAGLTRLGGIYMWGGNRDGKLGARKQKHFAVPTLLRFPDLPESYGSVCQIICGSTHSMALTSNGRLYSWGSNRYGQLGRDSNKHPFDSRPAEVSSLSEIISADCGLFHSAAVNQSGQVFTWGLAQKGALGHHSSNNEEMPRLVESLQSPIQTIHCGEYMTTCLDENTGRVYITGRVTNEIEYKQMTPVPEILSVTDLFCAKNRIILLIRGSHILLQRHAIEGNTEPFQLLSKYLCERNRSLASKFHEIKTPEGNNLLHLACLHNQAVIVEYILFQYSNFNVQQTNKDGQAPIHICAIFGHDECLKLLLLHPHVDINQKDEKLGNAAIHYSVENGRDACLRLLVYHGAEKSIFNNKGDTPLHMAIKTNYNLSRFLICHAASTTDKDATHREALEYCGWGTRLQLKEMAETNEVFISYAHVDHAFALKVRKALNCFSLRCWMDDWRLEAGSDWRTAIGNGLMRANVVIFIASKNSVISEWCLKELYLAQELGRKIIIAQQEDVREQKPLLDIKMATLLEYSKQKDMYHFEKEDFDMVIEKLARRTHGLLQFQANDQKHLNSAVNVEITEKIQNPNRLYAKKSMYVCFGSPSTDKSFIQWIQSHLKTFRIASIDSTDLQSGDIDERMVITNAWVYILVVSPTILESEVIQQHLRWIEQSRVHLILLYFDEDTDYMDLFPKRLFTDEQLRRMADLFSFCINDPPWVDQLIYTLNLLRKQTLLDRHLDMLLKRIEECRQQTRELDSQLQRLEPSNSLEPQPNALLSF